MAGHDVKAHCSLNLTLDSLPREIIVEIFSYLTTNEKKTVAQVCKCWQDICYSKILWRDVTPFVLLSTDACVLKSLAIRGIDSIQISQVDGRDISKVVSFFPELVCLTVEDTFQFAGNACKLESLKLLQIRAPTGMNRPRLSSLFGAAPGLRYLSLADCSLSDELVRVISTKLPMLQTLILGNNQQLTDMAVSYIAGVACQPGLQNLEELDLSHCKNVTLRSIELISNHLKNLQSFNVLGIIDNFWQDGFPLLPRLALLQKLRVTSCRDESVKHLVKLTSLKSLVVSGVLDLSERGASLLASMRCLVSVTAGVAASITDSCMAQLAKSPSLRKLSMCFCDNISRVGYSYFARDKASLTHLDISMCFLDDGVVTELGKIKTLKSLSLGFCYPLEDGDIDYLTRSLPCLEILELNGSDDLTDKCLVYVGQNLGKLRTLDVSDCPHISERAVRELARKFPHAQIEVNVDEADSDLDQYEDILGSYEEEYGD